MFKRIILSVGAAFLFSSVVLAQNVTSVVENVATGTDVQVIAGTPGEYTEIAVEGQMVLKTYEVTGVKPELRGNVAQLFKGILKRDGRGGDAQVATIVRDGKEIFILTISATEAMQRSIAQTIEKINSGEVGAFNYQPETVVYAPKCRPAEAIAAAIRPELTGVGMVYVDKTSNRLSIEDDPSYIKFLMWVVEQYDVPSPRVQAKITIVEVNEINDRNMGLDWNAWLDALPRNVSVNILGGKQAFSRSASVNATGESAVSMDAKEDGLSSLGVTNFAAAVEGLSPQALGMFLNFLAAKGSCRVVTTTDVSIMNGTPAVVSNETTVSSPVLIDDGKNKVKVESEVVEGVRLNLVGCLAQDGQTLTVNAQSTSIVGYSRSGIPMVSTSNMESVVAFMYGKTVVLSGLTRERSMEVTHGVPWLGRLTSKKQTVQQQSRLYVCITADKAQPVNPEEVENVR